MVHRGEHSTKVFSTPGKIPGTLPGKRVFFGGFFLDGKILGTIPGKTPRFQSATVVMQQVIIDGVTQVLQEFLEQEVTTKLGRAIRSPRQVSSQARPIDWQCAHCGCTDANQFTKLRPLAPQFGNRMGAPGRGAGAHAGMSAL
jgi:hypothetical protein